MYCSIAALFLLSSFAPARSSGPQWGHHHPGSPATESRFGSPKCLEIPRNFTLCHGMQYTSMRLPNLLEHETLGEAIQQSSAWISLLRLHCHQHAQLFLCSLFAPLCLPQLERPIQPCQSLCTAVEQGCAERMEKYGFPWPSMLNCSQFPPDNDMCIKPPPISADKSAEKQSQSPCKSCSQVATFENLMDNFCRSSIVLKVRLRIVNASILGIVRKMRVFKDTTNTKEEQTPKKGWRKDGTLQQSPAAGGMELIRLAEHGEGKCRCPFWEHAGQQQIGTGTFLVMASERRRGGGLAAKLVVPWRQEKTFKMAIRKFKKVNCSTLGREIRESVLSQMFRRRHQ